VYSSKTVNKANKIDEDGTGKTRAARGYEAVIYLKNSNKRGGFGWVIVCGKIVLLLRK